MTARLIYPAIASLDGYVADQVGSFDWGEPDEEVHTFVNDLQRPVGTHLYGRRMYEVMVAWENTDSFADQPSYIRDFAEIWQAADDVRVGLELLDERRFGNGMVHVRYREGMRGAGRAPIRHVGPLQAG